MHIDKTLLEILMKMKMESLKLINLF